MNETKLKSALNRRTFLQQVGIATAAAALPAPWIKSAVAQDFSGKELRVLTWSDATGKAAVKNILEPFAATTGARIIPDLTGSTSDMIAKIKASASRPQYDVVILSGFGANTLADADLLEKPDLGKLSNIAAVPEKYRTGADGHGVGYFLWSDGVLYNTQAYPSAPTSYDVFWNDSNANKLFIPSPKNLAAMELVMVATKLAGGDATLDPAPGFEMIAKLKDRTLTLATNPNSLADLYRSNSLNVGGPYSPLVVPKFIRDPAYNLSGTYDLEEGFFVDLQFMVSPKGHPGDGDAIHALYDFALSPDVQGKMAEEVWYGPISGAAQLSDAARNDPNVPSPQVIENRAIEVDSAFFASVREDWTARYTEAVT